MTYFGELKKSMNWLSEQPDTFFIGQAVGAEGTAMYNTVKDIDISKRLELPVFEEVQLGMSIGLSLEGFVPISIFPRWNFLLLAMNQLVNHLDKFPLVSDFKPKVIIRTGIGSVNPLDPQFQHKGDFTEVMQKALRTVKVVKLVQPSDIFDAYVEAYHSEGSTILCEVSDFMDEEFRKTIEKFTLTCSSV